VFEGEVAHRGDVRVERLVRLANVIGL